MKKQLIKEQRIKNPIEAVVNTFLCIMGILANTSQLLSMPIKNIAEKN